MAQVSSPPAFKSVTLAVPTNSKQWPTPIVGIEPISGQKKTHTHICHLLALYVGLHRRTHTIGPVRASDEDQWRSDKVVHHPAYSVADQVKVVVPPVLRQRTADRRPYRRLEPLWAAACLEEVPATSSGLKKRLVALLASLS
jgi:hypothetical protein